LARRESFCQPKGKTRATEETVKVGLEDLGKLKPASRERVSKLLGKLMVAIATKRDTDLEVNQALEDAAS
jgi:hypothetical protein